MSKYLLFTGATGLVGRYLLRDFLSRGERLAVLVRPSKKETAAERIEGILQYWEAELGRSLPRPIILEGDVTQAGLGLDRASRRWVMERCGRVLHNAAVLTFTGADRSDEPWRTNLDGTANLLAFCEQTELTDLHYVSTAYVCGTRPGVIRENEFDCGQTFRNDYEQSKFLAEQMVRQAGFLRRLTVYRPAVIAGDSRTGYTSTYHGLYMYLQMMSVINSHTTPDENGVRHTPVRLNMTGDEPRNIVPVDWVSEILCRLVNNPKAWGQTYHLSPREHLTPRKIVDAGHKYFNSTGVVFCGSEAPLAESGTAPEKAVNESKSIYEQYEASDPIFDTTNLDAVAADSPCPVIDEPMLHRFWRYGEEDKWGRRREPKPQVEAWAREILPQRAAAWVAEQRAKFNGSNGHSIVGFDVLGPGGGQWTWTADGSRQGTLEPGLPGQDALILRMSVSDLLATAVRPRKHESATGSKLETARLAPNHE